MKFRARAASCGNHPELRINFAKRISGRGPADQGQDVLFIIAADAFEFLMHSLIRPFLRPGTDSLEDCRSHCQSVHFPASRLRCQNEWRLSRFRVLYV